MKSICAAMACMLMVLSSAALIAASDASSAESGGDGAIENADGTLAFEGLVFTVTGEDGSEGEVGLSGISDSFEGNKYTIPGSIVRSDGETEIVYIVSSIMKGAFEGRAIESILLPTTLAHIENGSLSSASSLPASVTLPGILSDDGKTVTVPYSGAEIPCSEYLEDSVAGSFIDASTASELICEINVSGEGELGATNIADFEEGRYTIAVYADVVNKLPACEYEREYFDFAGWAASPDGEPTVDDGADVILGEDVSAGETLYAVWEENRDFGYPESYMYATCAIILALAAIGIAMMAYRRRQRTA